VHLHAALAGCGRGCRAAQFGVAVVAPLPDVAEVVPVDDVAVDPVASPVEVELEVLVELVDESEDVPIVSAAATP